MDAVEEHLASSLDAGKLLGLLADGEPVTFQAFDDTGADRSELRRILHGTLADHAQKLASLNARGAGVFWMVNEGDGKGRASANVLRVRALFVDLDGAPLEPVRTATLPPHCIVESSIGHWHAYWRVVDCPLSDFNLVQKALAVRFGADPRVCDLPRVMRLPGFDHRKGVPFRTRIVQTHNSPPYLLADVRKAFDLLPPSTTAARMCRRTKSAWTNKRALPQVIRQGKRNSTLLSLAGGLVRKGHDLSAVIDRLQQLNATRCTPPLCPSEVNGIAERAVAYGSSGFASLPHAMLDSPEWKSLPPAAHDIIVKAFRRFNGTNNGDIALTWADFRRLPGFGKRETFYKHRARAVDSGILVRTSLGRNTKAGKAPDLFAIAAKYVPSPRKGNLAPVPETGPPT